MLQRDQRSRWLLTARWAVGLAGTVLAATALLGGAAACAQRLRLQAQQDADRLLAQGGYPWARLSIDDARAYVQGDAPDAETRAAAFALARRELAPMMGIPGIFATLEDGMHLRVAPAPGPDPVAPPMAD